MATRSTISIQEKGKIKTIYCHWDGYPSNNGKLLKKHYNTPEKVRELVALGGISILGTRIGRKVKFDSFNSQKNKQTLAYLRDRGENQSPAITQNEKRGIPDPQEYDYKFVTAEKKWYVRHGSGTKFFELTDRVIELNTCEPVSDEVIAKAIEIRTRKGEQYNLDGYFDDARAELKTDKEFAKKLNAALKVRLAELAKTKMDTRKFERQIGFR